MNFTVPGILSFTAVRTSAVAIMIAVCASCPQACMTSTSRPRYFILTLEANGRPGGSFTGSASMSARNATTGPGLAPFSRPTTPVLPTPVFTSRARLVRWAATSADVRVSCSPSSGCSWMSRRQAISLLSIAAARCRISFSRSGTGDCACACSGMDVTRRANGSEKRRCRDMGFLRAGMGIDARVPRFNRDSPDELKFGAQGSDFRGFPEGPVPASEPVLPFEEDIGQRRRDQHQHDGERIAQLPVELRHVLEIHAVDRGDQGRRHQHDGRDREYLDDVVLLDRDDAKQGIEHECDLAGKIAGVVGQRLHVALHAAQL